ncbi:hypothetical protein MA16_Dca009226 [Dendrobium catenatum]|uniref:Uncharacterized protein n=1 Tax=Dendrobium catenatum TaxID=906689 RepID=A0A2I0VR69_9ASPA|nr:hypothetical protein MA16_Dca009226 [Dendrobium catenatum]
MGGLEKTLDSNLALGKTLNSNLKGLEELWKTTVKAGDFWRLSWESHGCIIVALFP